MIIRYAIIVHYEKYETENSMEALFSSFAIFYRVAFSPYCSRNLSCKILVCFSGFSSRFAAAFWSISQRDEIKVPVYSGTTDALWASSNHNSYRWTENTKILADIYDYIWYITLCCRLL
ncbi:MAG TPA: hypothetical protein P5519_02940 [Spirochaetia bacterium]|nr:hypothetical protein [Spirochaetales bacterium]HRS64827.1 hypothetical protein [Spirochaetia bacterium]HOT58301.1 hypothetical protein [Spirochaetales bacterium]HPD79820.1 hypothetical protein [Spirochaetales bacterium]HQK33399.1 hypothetical protein [Spirochaetales bacterium]